MMAQKFLQICPAHLTKIFENNIDEQSFHQGEKSTSLSNTIRIVK